MKIPEYPHYILDTSNWNIRTRIQGWYYYFEQIQGQWVISKAYNNIRSRRVVEKIYPAGERVRALGYWKAYLKEEKAA